MASESPAGRASSTLRVGVVAASRARARAACTSAQSSRVRSPARRVDSAQNSVPRPCSGHAELRLRTPVACVPAYSSGQRQVASLTASTTATDRRRAVATRRETDARRGSLGGRTSRDRSRPLEAPLDRRGSAAVSAAARPGCRSSRAPAGTRTQPRRPDRDRRATSRGAASARRAARRTARRPPPVG